VSRPRWSLVTVDIDGTLTTVHGWRQIAAALGRSDRFAETNRRFFAKEIGEDEHLKDMLELVDGVPLEKVHAILESTPRLRRIGEGVRDLHEHGTRVALLTHNPPYVCEWYCRQFGFDDFEGAAVQEVVDGIIGAPRDVRADKPSGLRALLARSGTPAERVVHVGDGWADAVIFPLVGRGVALNAPRPEVRAAADLAIETDDFRELTAAIELLEPRP
jgi:phosphoserine phosphatase